MAHFGEGDASFQAAGGYEGICQLVDDFYQIMDGSEGAADVRRLYPEDLSEAHDKLTRFLCGWLGGPRLYLERYGQISIPAFHVRWAVNEAERDIWLSCMADAIERQDWSGAFKEYLMTQLRVPADRIVLASQAVRHR
ncbi:group II truncated hemoglobin [Pseudomonas sp. OIL-1]|uniref:group II truncated hemoglobin n=1 Tax=Pseudomonas sp. OIL-1 TaxID=2706126 RepID=UPI0013A763DC|nr:group II truncated hemoglobin [Pseudomonas sp. OIL-1]QIB51905.1 group II truncated hemoglobin [Pseudomonas sp. OIL-1]